MMRRLIVRGPGLRGPAGIDGTDGADGIDGADGLPGVNAVPADSAVAAYVATSGSATKAALATAVAPLVDAGLVVEKARADVAYDAQQLPEASAILSRLSKGLDANLTVVGDSTGQGNTTTSLRWPYRIAVGLGQQFPAATVLFYLWNSGTLTYDAPVTLQTGTGTGTLRVYSYSASGETTTYSLTNLAVGMAAIPDLILVNHGLNHSTANIVAGLRALLAGIRKRAPKAPVVLVSQNPKRPAAADYADQLLVRQAIVDYATAEGYGLIDLTGAFLAVPTWATTLVDADTIHPTYPDGYAFIAAHVMSRLTYKAKSAVRSTRPIQPSIFIPAPTGYPSLGSPVIVSSGNSRPTGGYALDGAAQEAVTFILGGPYEVPVEWAKVLLRVHWSFLTEPGGGAPFAVVWDAYTYLEPTTNPGNWNPARRVGTGITSGGIPASGEANQRRYTDFSPGTAYELTERGRFALEVRRFANTAADTLVQDAILIGVEIIRTD